MDRRIAADFMSTNVITTRPDHLLTDAIDLLLAHRISCLPVVDDDGHLLGLITEYDIINFALSGEAARTLVSEAMSTKVVSFSPDTDLETIANCCVTHRIHRAPIVDGGVLVGIVSRRDLLREVLAIYRKH